MTLFSLKSKRKKQQSIETYTDTDTCNALQKIIDLLTNGHSLKNLQSKGSWEKESTVSVMLNKVYV